MNFDIYTMVTTTGKKKEASTIVYFLVSKGNENFVSSSSDPEIIKKSQKFLEEFAKYVKEYELNQKIVLHNNNLTKLQKEYDAFVADKEKMQSQISDLEKKVASKDKDIENKKNEIEKIQAELEKLKASF